MNFLARQKQGVSREPVCFNCFRPPGDTHSLHSTLAPSTPCGLWGLLFLLFAPSDHPVSPPDTKISICRPWRSCNAGWPSYNSLYIGLCSPCPEQPTNHSTRSTQEREGRVNGSSQWAPALDWSRHNYHVNILQCIKWYDTHTLLGWMFHPWSQWATILWWVSFGGIRELKKVWRWEWEK